MRMKRSIRKSVWIRIILATLSILVFCVAVNISAFYVRSTQTAMTRSNSLLDQAQSAKSAHYKWCSMLSNSIYTGVEFTGSLDDKTCDLGQWIYGDSGTDDTTIQSFREELRPLHKEIHESASYVLELLESNPAAAQSYYHQTVQTNVNTLVGILDEMISYCEELSASSQTTMNTAVNTLRVVSLVCFVLSLLCLFSLIQFVIRQVVRPILHITERASVMKDGRLKLDLDYQSDNELGTLAHDLKASMDLIYGYVQDLSSVMARLSEGDFSVHTQSDFIGDFHLIEESIETVTEKTSEALREISAATEEVRAKTEQVAAIAHTIATGSTEQAASVGHLLEAMHKMQASSQQNAKTATETRESALQAKQQLSTSYGHVKDMIAAMSMIKSDSKEIEAILSTIEDIAFQTNILALNAAVEAARAGESGKGFAVVADEVRALAIRSDEAAKKTKALIEKSMYSTEHGQQIVSEVSESLKETMGLTEKSVSEMGEIADAVNSEVDVITQVTQGLDQISIVIQNNSATSEESAAVSSELFAQVSQLKAQTQKFKQKA